MVCLIIHKLLYRCLLMRKIFLLLVLLPMHLIAQTLHSIEGGPKTSIRGMSVVNPLVVWLSGSNGWTAKSTDGGRSWSWKQSDKYKAFDFRGIKAFSANRAVVMSSGTPGLILYTNDGGTNWTETYRNDSKEIFLDGMSLAELREKLGMPVYAADMDSFSGVLSASDSKLTLAEAVSV